MDPEKEIKKVRDEAAKYRTQLAPYKEAFGDLETEAVKWMLDTIKLVTSDATEAGKRFASLAYANLGEDNFKDWFTTVVADESLVENTNIGDNEIMNAETSGQPETVDITEWAQNFENKVMGAIDGIEKKNQERVVQEQRNQQFQNIHEITKELGYDPDTWQGKMLLQVASAETDNALNLRDRLVAAHEIVETRIVKEQPTEGLSSIPSSITEPATSNNLDVPATGGQVGGGGIPDINGEDPVSFGDANDALRSLLKSEIGA